MAVNFSMFDFFLGHKIRDNVMCYLIITKQLHLMNLTKFQFLENLFDQHKFVCEWRHCLILSFKPKLSNHIFVSCSFSKYFFAFYRYKYPIVETLIYRGPCPINIMLLGNLGISYIFIQQSLSWSLLKYLRIWITIF